MISLNKDAKLSQHFSLGELTKTKYKTEDGNIPSRVVIENLKRLCPWLEELRYSYNTLYCLTPGEDYDESRNVEPIIINSGYRSPEVNRIAGGAANSNHLTGCAVDIRTYGIEQAMKTSALFQKAWRNDPKALPLNELLDMATVNGAKALRLNSGRLVEGALADISIVETDSSYFLSPGPFLANLVYSAHSDCIDSVICDGRFLMRHREIPGEQEILTEARKVLAKIS